MRHIRIPLLVVALSLTLTGMAFALDLPALTTWANGAVGLTVGGVGGGGFGRGDVLLGPLYDVRNLTDPGLPGAAGTTAHAQQTLIAILNTDPTYGVVGRLRFREWKRSWEVLDLDIPLTSNDVWVGVISRLAAGGAVLTSPDLYITNIADVGTYAIPFVAGAFPTAGFAFNPILITDGDSNALARTEYGHFEFIGEEIFSVMTASGTISRAVVNHDVGNTLEGTVFLIRPEIAISHQYNMTAIANFSVDTAGIYNSPTTAYPNLLFNVQGGPNPLNPQNPGAGGFDNLEALLSKNFLDYQYVTGTDPTDTGHTPMTTSVVVTFPTKFYHYEPHVTPFPILASTYPFGAPFTGARETLGDEARATAQSPANVGEIVSCNIWDRLEHLLSPPVVPISPSGKSGVCVIPYEVNIIGLYPTAVPSIGFRNNLALATANSTTTFYSGWGRIGLSPAVAGGSDTRSVPQGKLLTSPATFNFYNNYFNYYRGLPAIGIVMTEFYNGSVSGYYGNTVPWQYGVDWRFGATTFP